jgi:amidase
VSSSVVERSAFVPHDLTGSIQGRSDGLLKGFTAAIKDLYDVAGYRTGGGSPEWLESTQPAETHAGAVQKLLDAGATIIGKTICDEFFYSISGANAHYGTPVNPRAPSRLPGGSSSGSAVACATGACDLALGSDAGGSMRIPAAFCGLYGIRTGQERFDMTGAMAMAPSLDAGGWFSATPGLFRRAGEVLLEPGERPAPIGQMIILDDGLENADEAVVAVVQAVLAAAQARLPTPAYERAAPEGLDSWREAMRIVQAHEVWTSFGEFITERAPNLGPGIRERMEIAATISKDQTDAARQVTKEATDRMHELAAPGTVIALPTAPSIAPPLALTPDELESFRVRTMRLVCMASISGLPQVSIPVGTADGAPIGLSFIGWPGSEEALLSLATTIAPFVGVVAE